MNIFRALDSSIRVALCVAWTVVVGVPLAVILYGRYAIGVLCSLFGRPEILETLIDRNLLTFHLATRDLWSRGILVMTRTSFRSKESQPIDWSRTHVICANHTSVFDIFALMCAVPGPVRFVAKRELLSWPLIGWVLKPAGQVIVDRRNTDSAIESISDAARRDIRGQIIFFVEGTRSRDGELLPFKKGAFHFALTNHLPLLPTAIGGARRTLPRQGWWHLRPGSEILVDFCSPIEAPSAWAERDRSRLVDELLEQTRAAVAAELDRYEADRSAA